MANARPRPVAFLDRYFYFSMSLLLAAIVVYGFSQTVNEDLLHASPVPPGILWVHSIVYPGWVVFFIAQSGLVRTRNVRVHRTLGWFGVALAVTMVVVAYVTVIDMDRFIRDVQHYAPIVPFTIVQLADPLFFAATFGAAIYYRRQPEFHRRLMLVAYCSLLGAAFSRFPHMPMPMTGVCAEALVVLGMIRDWIVNRRVHRAYLYTLPVMVVYQNVAMAINLTAPPWWMHVANWLLRS
jgi:hypothetical protein